MKSISIVVLLLVVAVAPAQRRSPREPMTHHERKKLEGFEDRHDPYRPAWLGRTRFNAVESLRDKYPFKELRLERKEAEFETFFKRYEVVQASDQATLFVYDRPTRRLAFVVEYRRRGRTVSLKRWVRYHPSFTAYTITDLKPGDLGDPTHTLSTRFVRSVWNATSKGEMVTGSGPFLREATHKKASWLRDGDLYAVLRLLNVPPGPTHDGNDTDAFGDKPYRPLWAADVPFAKLRRLGSALPFRTNRLQRTPLERTHEVKSVEGRSALLVYDKKTKLLAYLVEIRATTDGTSRRRVVAYHPSFSSYTVYDVRINAIKRPIHRVTTRYARKGWKVSPKNKRKIEGDGPFVRTAMMGGGTADFGGVVWQLMVMNP
ncbi:MAG: hypothetical protein CMJ83_13415 [Planctomycetes bacterium]|nr:hypothetical protein [Planctomycetota bacterium]